MALVTMSRKELGRLEALVDLDAGRITAAQAVRLIGVGERQVFRLLKADRVCGGGGASGVRAAEGVRGEGGGGPGPAPARPPEHPPPPRRGARGRAGRD